MSPFEGGFRGMSHETQHPPKSSLKGGLIFLYLYRKTYAITSNQLFNQYTIYLYIFNHRALYHTFIKSAVRCLDV